MNPADPTDLARAFVLLWAVIDPLGTVPVFLHATRGMPKAIARQVARRAAVAAAAILVSFLVAGQLLLEGLDIPLPAFQISGGIVLFLFALTMIFGESKPEQEIPLADEVSGSRDRNALNAAIYPLAIPSLASPGAMMAVVLLTDNKNYTTWGSLLAADGAAALVVLVVVAIAWLLMRLAQPIEARIGEAGASIISRVMGLILAAVATTNVLGGIRLYFEIA